MTYVTGITCNVFARGGATIVQFPPETPSRQGFFARILTPEDGHLTLADTGPLPRLSTALIVTGPLPFAADELSTVIQRCREAAWDAGAARGQGVRYVFEASVVAWDGAGKRLWIVADTDMPEEDWAQVCGVLRMAGWMRGDPRYDDIGEPGFDPVHRVWVWDLPCP